MASEGPPRVFIDTNVLFSALITPGGIPFQVVNAAVGGAVIAVISLDVLVELARNVRRKVPARIPDLERLLKSVPLEVMARPDPADVAPWLTAGLGGDAEIIAAALASDVRWLCTGDKWPESTVRALEEKGVHVRAPAQLLAELEAI